MDDTSSNDAVTTRRFGLAASASLTSSPPAIAGAITASMNVDVKACAVARSMGRFSPTMPPKAESGSASRAQTYAAAGDAAGRDAARIRVLDHHRGRLVELQRDARGRVQIEQIRERQFLALMHDGAAKPAGVLAIPRAGLMRILAVPQIADSS